MRARRYAFVLALGSAVLVLASAGVACSSFEEQEAPDGGDAAAEAAASSDGPSADTSTPGDAGPAGALGTTSFDEPGRLNCGEVWSTSDALATLATGLGTNGTNACRVCSKKAGILSFTLRMGPTLAHVAPGAKLSLRANVRGDTTNDGGAAAIYAKLDYKDGDAGEFFGADSKVFLTPDSWQSAGVGLTSALDSDVVALFLIEPTVPDECVLIDDIVTTVP